MLSFHYFTSMHGKNLKVLCFKTAIWRTLMNDDGEVEALRSLVRLPWITQQHFVGMLQARRIDQVDVYFLFEWQRFSLENSLDSGYPFASVPAQCRQRCCKRGCGDGQRLWDYITTRLQLSDLSIPLTSEVRRSPEPSARPSAAADSEERQICTTCLFAESVGLCLLQISSNFALARSLSANQSPEIAQNRNIDPRDIVRHTSPEFCRFRCNLRRTS